MYRSFGEGGGGPFAVAMPRIVKILMWVNVGVFIVQWLTGHVFSQDPWFTNWFGLNPQDAVQGFRVWQFLTYGYLHSVLSPFHIVINMLMLWWFGSELARHYGTRRFLILYHLSIFAGGVLHAISAYVKNAGAAASVIGASGAVYGLMVVYAFLFPRRIVYFMLIIPIEMRYLVMILVGLDLISGTSVLSTGTAHFCHLGGALAGFLYYRYHGRIERFWERVETKIEEREAQREDDIRDTVDELLEKIRRDGMHTLSAKEKRFLNNASKLYKKEDHLP